MAKQRSSQGHSRAPIQKSVSHSHHSPIERHAQRFVPKRRSLILLESALILGLSEGVMWNFITTLNLNVYLKAALLMAGVIGVFALAVRILEPIIESSLKVVSRLDAGNAFTRLGLHLLILFIIFVGYVRIFFKAS